MKSSTLATDGMTFDLVIRWQIKNVKMHKGYSH